MTEGTDEGPGESGDSGEATPPAAAGDVDADDGNDDRDGNGGAGTDLAARVATLERTVTELRETVERQRRNISYLAAAADIDSVEPVCPDCGEGVLERSSGLTWTQVSCPECGLKRYL
jgi:predicted RNA-binding Zn-ribbon protein involved in translation (DUF1610 family)